LSTLAPNPLWLLADELDPPNGGLVDDPVAWGQDKMGAYCWSKIDEICQSVVDNRFTAVHSCHGIGKSWSAGGLIVPWWIDVHPVGSAKVVTTAPTSAQVDAILWGEIDSTHAKLQMRGKITASGFPKWHIGRQLVAFGRKPQDLKNEEQARQAFQGIHAKYVLVVLDEACGVPGWLWDAAMALVTNRYCRILAIGNPDDPTSRFKEVCMQSKNWNVIHVDAYDSPLFTGEYVPDYLRDLLISPEWVEEMREEWGEDSPIFQSKVRGRFPEDSEIAVIPWSFMVKRRNIEVEYTDWELQPNELGIDPAAGGDQFSIHWRTGPKWRGKWNFTHKDTMISVGECVRIILETGATRVKIDSIGIGKGVADRLTEVLREQDIPCEVVQVHTGTPARSKKGKLLFKSLRCQLWWEVGRRPMERGEVDLSELDDRTAAQLTSVQYSISSTGRIDIEPKADTKARIKRSPDDADAYLLAYFSPTLTDPGPGGSVSKGPETEEPVIRKGDLVLKGRKYADR
jgi:hypothetical protein